MNLQDFSALCRQHFANNALPCPTEEQIQALFTLTEHMLKVNQSMNLTAIKEEEAVIVKHYVDSLLIANAIPEGATVLDVGCGAGFPTLPLAIFRPDLRITALDSTAKRIQYVQSTADLLGLTHVTAIAARAEELAHDPKHRESYDVVTARAVAALPVLAELCLPFARIDGRFVAMKAKQADEELTSATNAIRLCGGRVKEIERTALRLNETESDPRVIAIIEKISATPQNYPRHFSKISKKPL